MAVLFTTRWKKDTKRWLDAIDGALPDFQVFNGADDDVVVDWDAIEYALVWQPPPGMAGRGLAALLVAGGLP